MTGCGAVDPQQVEQVAEAIRQADAELWEEEPHFNMALARVYAKAAVEALQLTEERCYAPDRDCMVRRLVGPWRTAQKEEQ